jgi:hypothetical protein
MQADASRGNLCESIGGDRDRFLDAARRSKACASIAAPIENLREDVPTE